MLYNFNYDKYKLQFHEAKPSQAKPSQAKPSQAFTLNFLKFYVYLLIIENIILILENKIICLFIYFYKEIFYYISKMHNQLLQSIFVNKISIQDYKVLIQQRFFNKFNFYLKIKYNNNGGNLCYLKN